MTHTPGPWKITERSGFSRDNRPRFLVAAPDEPNRVCTVSLRGAPNCDSEISLANARLIARAPELLEENERLEAINVQLLEACEACVKVMDIKHILSSCPTKDCVICKAVEEMRAAIAAAKDGAE